MQLNDKVLAFLRKQYSQPHRHYHTIRHVLSLLNTILCHESQFKNPEAAYLAAWFHDAVYEIGDEYKNNELRSCQAFLSQMEEHHKEFYDSEEGQATCTLALQMIGATMGHGFSNIKNLDMIAEADLNDIGMFLDADLRILSASREDLLEFEANIRKEFSIYDDLVYNPTRKQVLESFLKRPKIYFSEMGEHWERDARSNLKFLIERLG